MTALDRLLRRGCWMMLSGYFTIATGPFPPFR
jgi:hypothetical protein